MSILEFTPTEAEILLEFVNHGEKDFDECYLLDKIKQKLEIIKTS